MVGISNLPPMVEIELSNLSKWGRGVRPLPPPPPVPPSLHTTYMIFYIVCRIATSKFPLLI